MRAISIDIVTGTYVCKGIRGIKSIKGIKQHLSFHISKKRLGEIAILKSMKVLVSKMTKKLILCELKLDMVSYI